jgi:hypothetical protein
MVSFHENFPSSSHLPDYMLPFGSSEAPNYPDQLAATAKLRGAIEDKILSNIHKLSPAVRNAGVYSEIILSSFDLDGEPIEIDLKSVDTVTHPDLPQYDVRLLAGPRRLNGSYMNAHDYSVPDKIRLDDVVRRRDVTLQEPPKIKLPMVRFGETPRISLKAVEDFIEVLKEEEKNRQLEQDLGINNQPIGLIEARTIALFISRGVTLPKTTYLKK